ncbi:hypothetical protein C4568_00360 [Candidatus Parcubacteria bacterium]|nr:MAG: hypothetical protein C4568_00360 [Candidatus Parcubacteria bacterium]
MKNASAKNTVAVLFVTVMALALSVGAFAGTASACDWDGNCGYGDVFSSDAGFTDYTFGDAGYTDYEYSSPGYTDYEYSSPGYTDYEYSSPGYTDYEYSSPGYTDYEYSSPGYTDYSYSSPSYSTYSTPTYSMPTYAYEAIPTSARSYVPTYVYSPSPVSKPSKQPTYSVATTPAPTYNTNTNANTNTNVNNPTAVATATTGDNTNVNTASTGAITNNFAPVINVGNGNSQRPVQHEFPRPVCTIYSSGQYNQVTLTWSSQNATTAFISPNVGSVPVNGSRQVYSQGYTTFTLTVSGPGGSATCQTATNPIYTVTPTAPTAPYVALSQIPYTGFDYGPVGNAIYWTAILAFAAAAGYLLVYGMPTFAFAPVLQRFALTTGQAGSSTNDDEDITEVFKSNLVASTEVATEEKQNVNTFELPVATTSHAGVTSDAMIIDRSSGTPRIVIARA